MLYIENLKITLTGYDTLAKYDAFGVQQKLIKLKEDYIKCFFYSIENNSIIAGSERGDIIIYDINELTELKRYNMHGGKIYIIIS